MRKRGTPGRKPSLAKRHNVMLTPEAETDLQFILAAVGGTRSSAVCLALRMSVAHVLFKDVRSTPTPDPLRAEGQAAARA